MSNTIPNGLKPRIIGAAQEALMETFGTMARANINGALQQGQILSGSLGQTLTIGVPQALTAEAVSVGVTAPSPTDVVASSRAVTIDKFYRSKPFAFTGTESQNNDLSSLVMEQIKEGVRAVNLN